MIAGQLSLKTLNFGRKIQQQGNEQRSERQKRRKPARGLFGSLRDE